MTKKNLNKNVPDANPDPITGAPGAHPIGTGLGAAGAGTAGAAIGAVGGPVGAVAGAVIGAVAGGLAGKAAAESVNPTAEDAYWRENYRNRSYVERDADYETYRPAYQYGWESRSRYSDRRFDEVESELAKDWMVRGNKLTWDRAKPATRDAWDRIEKMNPRDTD